MVQYLCAIRCHCSVAIVREITMNDFEAKQNAVLACGPFRTNDTYSLFLSRQIFPRQKFFPAILEEISSFPAKRPKSDFVRAKNWEAVTRKVVNTSISIHLHIIFMNINSRKKTRIFKIYPHRLEKTKIFTKR